MSGQSTTIDANVLNHLRRCAGALEAVKELHAPLMGKVMGIYEERCAHDGELWPCPTIEAVVRAMVAP